MNDCKSLNTVTFEDGCVLQTISSQMFQGSTLKEIILGNNIKTISSYAFYNSKLSYIYITDSVEKLSLQSFRNTPIKNITFGTGSNLDKIESDCFNGCTELVEIEFPSKLLIIEAGSFRGCIKLQTIRFQKNSTIERLSSLVFESCENLIQISIPSSLREVDASCFYKCFKLNALDVNGDFFKVYEGGLYDYRLESLYLFPPGLTEGLIASSTTQILSNAFYGDQKLKSLNFGNSQITTLRKDTFYECSSLREIDIPGSIEKIDGGCFKSCSGLETVRFAENSKITTLGTSTFSGCTCLKYIDFSSNASLTTIEESTFESCESLRAITLPSTITVIGDAAFANCISLSSVEFENGKSPNLKEIPRSCFSGCINLKRINIPNNVQILNDSTFSNSGLLSVSLNVSFVGSYCFSKCTKLENITLISSAITLKEDCFSECTSLKYIILCSESANEDNDIFGSKTVCNIYTLISYPKERLGDLEVERIMERCLIFPTSMFSPRFDSETILECFVFSVLCNESSEN